MSFLYTKIEHLDTNNDSLVHTNLTTMNTLNALQARVDETV